MKRIAHLFLTILCASGVLTLQGMHPMQPGGSDNDKKPKPLFNYTGEIDVDKSPEGLKRWQDILSNAGAHKASAVIQSAPAAPSSTDEKVREEETVQAAVPARPVAAIQKPTIVVEQGTLPSLALQHSDVKIQTELTAHNPRLGEVAHRSLSGDDQWQNVFDHAVAMTAVGIQQNPTRRLLDVVPGLNQLPKILWQTIIAPYLVDDYVPKMFPVPLMPMCDGKLKWINKDRSRAVIETARGLRVINPAENNRELYNLPGEKPTFSTDGCRVACQKGNKIKVIALESGEELLEIKKRSESDAPFLFCDDALLMAQRRPQVDNQPTMRCFDVTSRQKDNNWYMEGSTMDPWFGEPICRAGLLAIRTTANRVVVYNVKTRNKCFETDGVAFDIASDGSRIAVARDDLRIKIFDLTDKEHKELFDQRGYSGEAGRLKLTQHNKVVFQQINSRIIEVYDIASGQELIAIEGDESHLSPDEKLIAITTKRNYVQNAKVDFEQLGQDRVKQFVESHESYELYDIASKELVLQNNDGPFSFSPDSHYCFYANADQTTTMVHLSSRETWILPGSNPVVSPDGPLCSLFRMNKAVRKNTPYGYLQRVYGSPGDCVLETIFVDLMHKKELARFKSEQVLASRAFVCNKFSSNDLLEVSEHVMPDMPFGLLIFRDHISLRPLPCKQLFFDLSIFKDKKFKDALGHELTPEQSILLMLLEDTHQRNNTHPISLHEIAVKERVSLEELQDTLGSFHPLIAKSLIKRYAIIDHTPEITKALVKKSYLMQVAQKITGATAVVATIGALRWYLKK